MNEILSILPMNHTEVTENLVWYEFNHNLADEIFYPLRITSYNQDFQVFKRNFSQEE